MPRTASSAFLRRLSHHLRQGGLLAYPTESCYGIGCLPRNNRALRRLVRLKKRPQDKGMIVIGDTAEQLQPLLRPLDKPTLAELKRQWPARKTFLLPADSRLPPLLRGRGRSKLAVRVPDHAVARSLCRQLNTPLVSTSCNLAGRRPVKTERETRRLFGRRLMIVGGRIGNARTPSQIIDWASGRRLR